VITARTGRIVLRSTPTFETGGNKTVLDVIFFAVTMLFFAAGILYVRACERLR